MIDIWLFFKIFFQIYEIFFIFHENFIFIIAKRPFSVYHYLKHKELDMKKKPTYTEISKLTGISVSTISRVLNSNINVSKEKEEKIITAMQKLGYKHPLLQKKSMEKSLIIINLPSLNNPFYSKITEGIKSAATRNNYQVMIHEDHINKTTIDSILYLIKSTKAIGMITLNHIDEEELLRINDAIPIVQCCECLPSLDIPFVSIDDITASIRAVNYLISLGNKRIAMINGPIRYKYSKDRLKGYQKAITSAGFEVENKLIVQLPEINFDMAVSAVMQLLSSPNPPDAFFTVSDVYAAAVIRAAINSNLSVPKDVSVIGFDNVEISSMCTPNITTVSQPRFQLGLLSCDMLDKILCGEGNSVQSIFLETELIIRESTQVK